MLILESTVQLLFNGQCPRTGKDEKAVQVIGCSNCKWQRYHHKNSTKTTFASYKVLWRYRPFFKHSHVPLWWSDPERRSVHAAFVFLGCVPPDWLPSGRALFGCVLPDWDYPENSERSFESLLEPLKWESKWVEAKYTCLWHDPGG